MTTTATKHMHDHYAQLVGCKIVRTGFVPFEGTRNLVPVLQLQRKDGTFLFVHVMCDPEGNGPGFLDIQS